MIETQARNRAKGEHTSRRGVLFVLLVSFVLGEHACAFLSRKESPGICWPASCARDKKHTLHKKRAAAFREPDREIEKLELEAKIHANRITIVKYHYTV